MHHTNSSLPVNRTMPACSIIPVLGYADVPQAIEWLTKVFGFKERWRAGDHRAQMSFGEGAQVLQPPIDFPYGERQYNVRDIGGHVWVFSQSIADLAPEAWGGTSS